jgi:hypothetical protein
MSRFDFGEAFRLAGEIPPRSLLPSWWSLVGNLRNEALYIAAGESRGE